MKNLLLSGLGSGKQYIYLNIQKMLKEKLWLINMEKKVQTDNQWIIW